MLPPAPLLGGLWVQPPIALPETLRHRAVLTLPAAQFPANAALWALPETSAHISVLTTSPSVHIP